MSRTALPPVLPWPESLPEDLRFRQILGLTLSLFLAAGAIVPFVSLPEAAPDTQVDRLPPRVAWIIAEPVATAVPRTIRTPQPEAAPAERITAPEPQADPPPTAAPAPPPEGASRPSAPSRATPAPRPPVAQTGLLALSDSLGQLRRSSPKIATGRQVSGAVEAPARTAAELSADVTRSSGGIGDPDLTGPQLPGGAESPYAGDTAPRGRGEDRVAIRKDTRAAGKALRRFRSEEEIQEILNQNKRAIYRIYNRELATDPTLEGKVVLSLTIAPSGTVTECRVVYSELHAASFEQELVLLIKGIDFGAKRGVPPVTTHVPIEFFPV